MSETYMVMVLVPIVSPSTCIGAAETCATQIWARVTMRAAVGNMERQILHRNISARRGPDAAGAGEPVAVLGRQTASDRGRGARPMTIEKRAPGPGLDLPPHRATRAPRRRAAPVVAGVQGSAVESGRAWERRWTARRAAGPPLSVAARVSSGRAAAGPGYFSPEHVEPAPPAGPGTTGRTRRRHHLTPCWRPFGNRCPGQTNCGDRWS